MGWCVVHNLGSAAQRSRSHLGVYFFTKLPVSIVLKLQSGLNILPLGIQNVVLVLYQCLLQNVLISMLFVIDSIILEEDIFYFLLWAKSELNATEFIISLNFPSFLHLFFPYSCCLFLKSSLHCFSTVHLV